MTSNELRPSADVATLTADSPCPQFDMAVYSTLIYVHATAIDREVPPHEREAAHTVHEGALRRLVERVEEGRWNETLPEPEVNQEDAETELQNDTGFTDFTFATQPSEGDIKLAHDIMDLTDAQIWDQLQGMTYAERVEWFRSTD